MVILRPLSQREGLGGRKKEGSMERRKEGREKEREGGRKKEGENSLIISHPSLSRGDTICMCVYSPVNAASL